MRSRRKTCKRAFYKGRTMYGLISSRSARLVLGFALGLGAVAPWVAAREETIELDKVPKHIRHEIENGTKGGSHVVVILVKDDDLVGPADFADQASSEVHEK